MQCKIVVCIKKPLRIYYQYEFFNEVAGTAVNRCKVQLKCRCRAPFNCNHFQICFRYYDGYFWNFFPNKISIFAYRVYSNTNGLYCISARQTNHMAQYTHWDLNNIYENLRIKLKLLAFYTKLIWKIKESALVHIMALHCTVHYTNQWWPSPLPHSCIIKLQWVPSIFFLKTWWWWGRIIRVIFQIQQ